MCATFVAVSRAGADRTSSASGIGPRHPASDALLARVAAVLEPRDEILEAYVFGSHARGTSDPHSDVDVAVYVAEPVPRESRYGYDADLMTTLSRALGTSSLDVVVLNEAPPLLYHRVLRDGIRVVTRDLKGTITREGRALSRYCDYVPQLAKIEAAYRARLAADRFGR
jgi:predicted nucleotidyltransferase